MILKYLLRFALLLLLLPVLSQAFFAQARIGTVQGTIKDPTGALVPNAKVTISQPVTGYNQTTQTDQQGSFKLVNIPFNTYKVRAEAPDFEP
ncbi:MAG: carboxypeptidase-like regulatory domain-containing protein, partial [bacterium]